MHECGLGNNAIRALASTLRPLRKPERKLPAPPDPPAGENAALPVRTRDAESRRQWEPVRVSLPFSSRLMFGLEASLFLCCITLLHYLKTGTAAGASCQLFDGKCNNMLGPCCGHILTVQNVLTGCHPITNQVSSSLLKSL